MANQTNNVSTALLKQKQKQKQWGYKKGLSTELLLAYLSEKWKMEMDRGKFVGIILIDFCKAFDTVYHSIMQLKLQGAGLANSVAEWINDYSSETGGICF